MKTNETANNTGVLAQIAELQRMTVTQLRVRWIELYGEPSRSNNRAYLWRRLAWRLQEICYGGLSERAKRRLEELASEVDFVRVLPPRGWEPPTAKSEQPKRPARDPRLPAPGSTLTRQYHGREIRVLVLDDGYEMDGRRFDSLSALAREITGQKWNGRLFFGLTSRKKA